MQLVDSPKSWADWGSRHHCWNRWGKCYLLFLRFKIIQILFKTDIFLTWYFLHIAVPYVKAQVQCRSQGCPEVGFRRGLSAWARISPDCPRQECSYTDAHNQRAHCPRNNHPFVSLIQILTCQILFKTEIQIHQSYPGTCGQLIMGFSRHCLQTKFPTSISQWITLWTSWTLWHRRAQTTSR